MGVEQVAERYKVDVVRRAVEEEVVRPLDLKTFGGCWRCDLREMESMLKRFEVLTTTEGFTGMGGCFG